MLPCPSPPPSLSAVHPTSPAVFLPGHSHFTLCLPLLSWAAGSVPTGRAHARQMAAGRDWLVAPLGSHIRSPGAARCWTCGWKEAAGPALGGGSPGRPLSPQPETDRGCAHSLWGLLATHSRGPDGRTARARVPTGSSSKSRAQGRGEAPGGRGGRAQRAAGGRGCTATAQGGPLHSDLAVPALVALCGAGQDGTGPQGRPAGGHGLHWAAWVADWTNPPGVGRAPHSAQKRGRTNGRCGGGFLPGNSCQDGSCPSHILSEP